MHDVSTIESINREQLATASDRLLLRGRVWKQRAPLRTDTPHRRLAEGSQSRIAVPARRTLHPLPPARGSRTFVVRPPIAATARVRRGGMPAATAAVVIAIPTLVGFAIGLVAVL